MRHFIANPTMSEHGEHKGGFVGFLKSIGPLCNQFRPNKVIVVWESGGNQKRLAISGGTYKGGRRPKALNRYYEDDIPDTKENHNDQVSLVVEALKSLPVNQVYVKDAEADDIISYICKYKFLESKIVVVSSDKDLYQLIDGRVSQWSLNQKKLIDKREVKEKYGFYPENIVVARCFTGDDSDAIPGIKGAGFRTLLKRFPELGGDKHVSVNEVIDSARRQSSSNISLFKEIVTNEEHIRNNWKLMNLSVTRLNGDQVKKLEHQLETPVPQPNKMNLLRILNREGLRGVDIDSNYLSMRAVIS
jgi:DNA polymerase-1